MKHWDKDGNAISRVRWHELRETPGYGRVALDGDVSTVWLGYDADITKGDRSSFFETSHPSGVTHYANIRDALTGHAFQVEVSRFLGGPRFR